MMNLSDFTGVVSQVVVNDKWQIVTSSEESQNFAIIVKELLLGYYFSTSESFLEEFLHFVVLLGWDLLLGLCEGINWHLLGIWLSLTNIL